MAGLATYEKRLAQHENRLNHLGAFETFNGTWDYSALYETDWIGDKIDGTHYISDKERAHLIQRHAFLQSRIADIQSRPLCVICFEHTQPWDLNEDEVCKKKTCRRKFGTNDAITNHRVY